MHWLDNLLKVIGEGRIVFGRKQLFVRNAIGNASHDKIWIVLATPRELINLYIAEQVAGLAFVDCQSTYNPFCSVRNKLQKGKRLLPRTCRHTKHVSSEQRTRKPWTISIRTNFGDYAVKLIKMLEELKFCPVSQPYWTENGICSPFNASHSLTSTYFGSRTIVLIDPLTSCDCTYGSQRNKGRLDQNDFAQEVPLAVLRTTAVDGIGRIVGRGRSCRG